MIDTVEKQYDNLENNFKLNLSKPSALPGEVPCTVAHIKYLPETGIVYLKVEVL